MSKTSVCLSLLTLLGAVIASPLIAQEQPEPTTIWDTLGVSKVMKNFRKKKNALINKDGCNPGKEEKPQLLKLADKKNLESDNPIIAIAAKAKQDEDLAPQKIKALRYLGTLGCGCNADVEKAVMAGLDDCNATVRQEAVKLVLFSANKNPCDDPCMKCRRQPVRRLVQRVGKCRSCSGYGCKSCQNQGQVIYQSSEEYASCDSSGCDSCGSAGVGCGSCCSKELVQKLDKLANGRDKNGCFIEPDAQVRALAQRAMEACPGSRFQAVDDPDPVPAPATQQGIGTESIPTEGNNGIETLENSSTRFNINDGYNAPATYTVPENNGVPITSMQQTNTSNSNELAVSTRSGGSFVDGAVVASQKNALQLEYSTQYQFPVGSKLIVKDRVGGYLTAFVEETSPGVCVVTVDAFEWSRNELIGDVTIGVLRK